ncbi:AAA family ATPase [Palleronia abyssalis]|uniref:Tyrosine-protein kinase ptk n=1 Tax=Palleronia abyssalis TaxID=1501240 RepID=A0A2R8BX73_9RHOB|nr:AAA family ATPase [Palleronia abyssalis]SPJ24761.1 Tyrosine-protein kinase ptk [Palleronia abyssalis]
MTSAALAESSAIHACTVSRDIQNFEILIEDMEMALGEAWGDLSIEDAGTFLTQPDSETLSFIALALDREDEAAADSIAQLISTAVAKNISVLLIAEGISPMLLHRLLRLGAAEFIPYPIPDRALQDAIDRLSKPEPATAPDHDKANAATVLQVRTGGTDRNGVVLPVHGLAGGVGATTFAVNLANELSQLGGPSLPRVCILDLDLQMGAVATYLDVPQRDAVIELLSETETMDAESLMQAMVRHDDRLHVLTSPPELLPLDMLQQNEVDRLLDIACSQFDYVVIDMPSTVVQWTETVLNRAHVYFALMQIDMRSAQNALRLIRALRAEDLPFEKLRFIMNRAPKFMDLTGKSRLKRLAESLGVSIEVHLPDGGAAVTEANDGGLPLAVSAKKNPLRKEILKLAESAHNLNRSTLET